jgi:hypothetical protein
MDFITGLPTSTKQKDAIMVVVDKLSKSAHFIPIKPTCKAIDIAQDIHERGIQTARYVERDSV